MESPALLRQPAFRSLWLAGLISDAGDWLLFISLPIVVYRLTGSALGTSFAFLAELGPGIVLAPLAGRLADRVDRRRLLLTVTALQAATLPILTLVHGTHGLAIVYTVILVQAALSALFEPAKNALLPTLVSPAELVSANSLVALDNGLGRLIGGPLGGLLLAAGDLTTVVVADTLSFVAAGALIARLPRSHPSGVDGPAGPGAGRSPGGVLAVARGRRVRAGLLVAFVGDIAQGIFLVLFILFVARRLHGGSGETGLLRGVQAVGAIGGGLCLAYLAPARRPASLVAGAAIVFGVIDLFVWNAPGLTTATALYVLLFAIIGAPGVVMETGLVSFLQLAGRDGERGRIFAALGLAEHAGQALGMLAAGVLTAPLGLMAMLNAQAGLYLAAGGLAAWQLRRPSRWICVSSVTYG
jgi:MFS family permease